MPTGMKPAGRSDGWDSVFDDLPADVVRTAKFTIIALLHDREFVRRCERFTAWCQAGRATDGKRAGRGLRAA